MFNKKTIQDEDYHQKRILVRVDFNVPIRDGIVGDDTRIQAALPTIRYLLDQDAAVILCSHLGRPKGEHDPQFSLKPVADYLATLIHNPVSFCPQTVGSIAKSAAAGLSLGEVLVLENTRFNPGEKANDMAFAKQLADLADMYVNDAFGSAHRAHASTTGVTQYLPSAAGFLLEKEIRYLGQTIADPKHPFIAILGGAKVSDKIGVINNLLSKSDQILIGGGMANTFFKAQGYPVGDSLVEDDALDTARDVLDKAGSGMRLPIDIVIANEFSNEADTKVMAMGPIPDGWRIMDIGPDTIEVFAKAVRMVGTVVWNGPMGVFEFPNFAQGTFGVADAVAKSRAVSIIGGGDSVAAIKQSGLAEQITHMSTGGGASLEMLEGVTLPGLAALNDR